MFCKRCGKQIKDDVLFCPHCGQKVTIPSINRQEEKRETASKSFILAVMIGILIILVAVLAFMLLSKRSGEEEDFSREYERTIQESENDNADAAQMPAWNDAAETDTAAVEETTVEEAIAEEPVQEEAPSRYILPESNSAYLTRADLEGMTKEECRLARNELYARHGRRFDDEELQEYFNSCDWYEGTIAPADFDDSVLNEYEVANRDLIVMYEEEQGYR